MGKLTVSLCVGTSCHLMGGMDLVTVLEDIKRTLGDVLIIEKSTCLNQCRKGPNLRINGQLYTGMTPERLKQEIMRQLEQEGDGDGITGQ
jgi:NADH:ubiquinone oxidoreductase subunit E